VWGQCGTPLEGQASHDSGLGGGHKGPVRPTCIGTTGVRPVLILFYSILFIRAGFKRDVAPMLQHFKDPSSSIIF
jgi:hypothetical protein